MSTKQEFLVMKRGFNKEASPTLWS